MDAMTPGATAPLKPHNEITPDKYGPAAIPAMQSHDVGPNHMEIEHHNDPVAKDGKAGPAAVAGGYKPVPMG